MSDARRPVNALITRLAAAKRSRQYPGCLQHPPPSQWALPANASLLPLRR
jgi:hypothetical protein